jgi:lipoate-protein ligase B
MLKVCICLCFIECSKCVTPTRAVTLVDLSRVEVPYGKSWKWQQSLLEHHINLQATPSDDIVGHILLMQHNSVYTLGSATQVSFFCVLTFDIFNVHLKGQLAKN